MQESKFEDNDENEEEDDGAMEMGKLRVASVQRHVRACTVAFRRKQPNVARQIVSLLRLGEEYLRARPFYYHAVTCLNAARALCHKHRVTLLLLARLCRLGLLCRDAGAQRVDWCTGRGHELAHSGCHEDGCQGERRAHHDALHAGQERRLQQLFAAVRFCSSPCCCCVLLMRELRHFHLAGKAGLANTACSERDELEDADVEGGFPSFVTDTIQALFEDEWE